MVESTTITSKMITGKLKISDKVGKLITKDCYITIKDHKPDWDKSYHHDNKSNWDW